MNITFDNNTANLAPNIFISNFELCSWQSIYDGQVYFSAEDVLKWPVFHYLNLTTKYVYLLCVCMYVYAKQKQPGYGLHATKNFERHCLSTIFLLE